MTLGALNFGDMVTRMGIKLGDPSHVTWAEAYKQQNLNIAYGVNYVECLLAGLRKNDFFVKTYEISVKNGTQEYDLPSDFSLPRKVYREEDSYQELDPVSFTDKSYEEDVSTQDVEPTRYYIRDAAYTTGTPASSAVAKLGLVCKPSADFTLYVDYVAIPAEMSASTDLPVICGFFHELVVLDACIMCLEDVEDSKYKRFVARAGYLRELFKRYNANRHAGGKQFWKDAFLGILA